MAETKQALTENAAVGRKWFKPEYLPRDIATQVFSFSTPSRVQYHNGVTLFMVRSGEGELIVNGKSHAIAQGSCGLLYFCDFHRFLPKEGQTLKVTQCFLSYETFLFASVYPSNELINLQTSSCPVVIRPDEPGETARLIRLFDTLAETEKASSVRIKCAILFEILGRMSAAWNPTQP